MSVNAEINKLKDKRSRLMANVMPSSLLEIKVNRCYGDFGKSFTNQESFKGDVAYDMFYAAIDVLDKRIAMLEHELDEI